MFGITDWYRNGAAADYVAVEARNLAAKPVSLGHVDAAALSLAGLTAWQAFFVHGRLQSGQTVVVTGASGGVGALAVQLAADAGARVVAVARPWSHPLLRQLGAAVLVDPDDSETAEVRDADLLFDLVGGDVAGQWTARLRPAATVVSVVEAGLKAPPGGRSMFFIVEADRLQLLELGQLVEAGRLRPIVGAVADLANGAAEGFVAKQSGGVPGKIVFRVT